MTTAFRDGTRFALRDRTAACHARIDAAFGALDLAAADGLAAFLGAQHLALRGIEPVLADAPGLPPLPRRLTAIEADLAALGYGTPLGRPPSLGTHDPLGVAYVLGGSAQGGRLLSRRRAASGDAAVAQAGRFVDDPRMMHYWAAVLGVLRTVAPASPRMDLIARAATATFGAFADALREVRGDVHD